MYQLRQKYYDDLKSTVAGTATNDAVKASCNWLQLAVYTSTSFRQHYVLTKNTTTPIRMHFFIASIPSRRGTHDSGMERAIIDGKMTSSD